MIKLKEPLHLNSLNQLNRWNDSFENEILGKYELFPMSFHSEELLHLLKGEQEQADVSGMTQLIYNETYNENITLHVGILNQFINRMLALMEHRYTYNDYIYVSGFLTKVGISNTTEFLENTYNYLRETKLISDSVHMEEQNQNILSYVYNQLAEYNRSKGNRQEHPVLSEKEFAIQNLNYVNHILNRVGVKQHIQTVRKFRESTSIANDYSESAFYMDLQNLTDLHKLNYQTIAKTYALDGVTYCHINPYELPQEEKEAVSAETTSVSEYEDSAGKKEGMVRNTFTNMIAAALCNITDSVYKVHITRKDGEEQNFRSEIILDGADWSQKVYESSVRYVNNLLSNKNQWYFSLLRTQIYESGKNRLQMLERMVRSVKIMKQKDVSDVRERNQMQRIKETAAVQETLRSVLEQYTEHIETKEYGTHTVQNGMPGSAGHMESVEHTILQETEQYNEEQKLVQMLRKPSVSKIRKAVLQSFFVQEEMDKNFADVYVEADIEPREDGQEEKLEYAPSSELSEETREIFSLVQEYLINPEKVSNSGKIMTDAAAMLHYDIHNQSELSAEEYYSYQEKNVEKRETADRKSEDGKAADRTMAEESSVEAAAKRMLLENRQEYLMNPEKVSNSGKITADAAEMLHYDIHNQSELSAEEYYSYQEKNVEKRETSDRKSKDGKAADRTMTEKSSVEAVVKRMLLENRQDYQWEQVLETETGLPEIVFNEWGPYIEAYLKEQYTVSELEESAVKESRLAQQENVVEIVYQKENCLEELAEMWKGTAVSYNLTDLLQQHSSLFYDKKEQLEYYYTEQINQMYSVIQHTENLTKEEKRQIKDDLHLLAQSTDNRITREDRIVINQLMLKRIETVRQRQQLFEIFKKYENILVANKMQQNGEYLEQYEQAWNTIHNIQNMSWTEQKNLSVVLEHIRTDGKNITEFEQILLQKALNNIQETQIFHTDEVRQMLEREILEQVYTEQGTYAGDVKLYVNNLTQEGSLSYVYSQETENQYNSAESQYQNNFGSNTNYNKIVNQSVQWNESSINNTESSNMLQVEQQNTIVSRNGRDVIKQTQNSNTERMERERIRTEMEHILEKQINSISEKVYSKLERKLSSERKRRGY